MFVLNGRGNDNLLCFRIFEAVMNGSIPVVIGRKINEEKTGGKKEGSVSYYLGRTFMFDDMPATVNLDSLPWVVGRDWEDASERVERLLGNPLEMDDLQRKMMNWWDKLISGLRNQIFYALRKRWIGEGKDPRIFME